jgi:hypothetical protein
MCWRGCGGIWLGFEGKRPSPPADVGGKSFYVVLIDTSSHSGPHDNTPPAMRDASRDERVAPEA